MLSSMPDLVPTDTEVSGSPASGEPLAPASAEQPPALQVEGLEKTFRLPRHQVSTLKERAFHPFRRGEFDELNVLRGVSFDVAPGEFFGIVGRNGSGKSTLLKCMAGIYRADAGTVRVAGRLAPFIELGVGFNPDLTARDNVTINAVMMGLTPAQARERFDEIIAFAELEQFVDMKLKNYSSGMQVRLAFAVMVQSGADILLIDEVLAVGDAAFQQRCLDEFRRLRDEGRTVVLVTHDMEMVERFCHRALLLTDGRIEMIDEPSRVARRYLERNFEDFHGTQPAASEDDGEPAEGEPPARGEIVDVWLENDSGARVDTLAHGERLRLNATIEIHDHVREPIVEFWVDDEEDARILGASTRAWDPAPPLDAGDRLHVVVEADNILANGRYLIGCSLLSGSGALDIVALVNRHKSFHVFRAERVYGLIAFEYDLRVTRDRSE
jgi:ABC-2 type transport system ATP-binding protein